MLLVLLVAGGFAASHGMHHYQNARAGIEWTRLALADTYLEIPIFLLLAILIGQALPSLAVVFVLVFGVLDIAVAATQPQELTPVPWAFAGRLVAIWALWLLVVELPVFGRSLAGSWRAISGNRGAVAALLVLTAGAFTWFWTQAAPILVRPMFVWSDLGAPAVAAVRPVQEGGAVFAVWAVAVAGGVAMIHLRAGIPLLGPEAATAQAAPRVQVILRALVAGAVITVSLGGLIATPLEAAVIFAAVAGSGPLAQLVADRTVLGYAVRVTPPPIRYVAAAGVSIGVCWLVVGQLYQVNLRANIGPPHNEFFSVVFAIAVAFFLVALVTTPSSGVQQRRAGPASTAITMSVLAIGLQALILATPVTAFADNCASLNDCWDTVKWTALAASALPFLMAYRMLTTDSSFRHKNPPPPPDRDLYPPPPPWKKDPYMWPGGDHLPPENYALHSAGGTRA